MWKYIVTWTLMNWVWEPCPLPMENKYGEIRQEACAVMHGYHAKEHRSREFKTRQEAIDFMPVDTTGSDYFSWSLSDAVDFELDSVWIKK